MLEVAVMLLQRVRILSVSSFLGIWDASEFFRIGVDEHHDVFHEGNPDPTSPLCPERRRNTPARFQEYSRPKRRDLAGRGSLSETIICSP